MTKPKSRKLSAAAKAKEKAAALARLRALLARDDAARRTGSPPLLSTDQRRDVVARLEAVA